MSRLARMKNSLPKACNLSLQIGQSNPLPQHPGVEKLLTGRLPVYNGDLEANVPQSVLDFKKHVASADGIIICTPEYNYSY